MSKQLVFVHGRAQENKDSTALKAEWLEALNEGFAKSKLTLPIFETECPVPVLRRYPLRPRCWEECE